MNSRDFSARDKKAEMERTVLALPLHFCDPVLIGRPPALADARGASIFSATVTYLDLGGRRMLITSAHVVRHFERERQNDGVTIFQVPGLVLDELKARLIDIDDDSDLATIDAGDLSLASRDVPRKQLQPRQFYHPARWPPEAATEGDVVAYAGWPGALRHDSADLWDIESNPYSMIGMPITSAMMDRFNVKLDRSDMTLAFGRTTEDPKDYDFGGMSGGPVLRRGTLSYELIGIISEYNEVLDQFVCTSAANIKSTGKLWHNTRR
jgi:hypothetical protein